MKKTYCTEKWKNFSLIIFKIKEKKRKDELKKTLKSKVHVQLTACLLQKPKQQHVNKYTHVERESEDWLEKHICN